jgi:hypothetical protein
MPEWLKHPVAFTVHLLVGAFIFNVLAGTTLLLNLETQWAEQGKYAPFFVIWGMKGVEYVMWAADIFLLLALIVREVVDLWRSLWPNREA